MNKQNIDSYASTTIVSSNVSSSVRAISTAAMSFSSSLALDTLLNFIPFHIVVERKTIYIKGYSFLETTVKKVLP